MEVKKSNVEMPEMVLEKKLSLRAVYVYAKMQMFSEKDVVYNRKCWVTNPYSRKQELSEDALSDITKKLVKAGLIKIVPVETTKSRYKTNTYEIVPFEDHYKPVAFDFINHTELSAEAKGLAILMCLLQYIPKSASAIGKAIGISSKTVKKYLAELETGWVYNREKNLLDEHCFPYNEQVKEKRERHEAMVLEEYKEAISTIGKKRSSYSKHTMQWIQNLDEPDEIKAWIWRKATMGFWKVNQKERQKREAEEQARKAKIAEIEL
jgi:DNA-binding MarR family transcriptional regulator